MNTARIIVSAQLLVGTVLVAVGCLVSCQQLCQSPGGPYTTFTGQQWRLVSTTNPSITGLSNTNFEMMQFAVDFTGSINRVQDNQEITTPLYTFQYNVDPTSNTLKVQYTIPTGGGDGGLGNSAGDVGNSSGGIVTYTYQLGTDFVLTEQTTGYSYTFVPFQGVVLPDESCTFQ
jgi:hypothetical protein